MIYKIFDELFHFEIFKILTLDGSVPLKNRSRSLKLGQGDLGLTGYIHEFFQNFLKRFLREEKK